MGSIEQRASGSWSVYWRNQGRTGKQRITVGPDAEKLALRILDMVNARKNKVTSEEVERFFGLTVEVDDDGAVRKSTPTVDELADEWLTNRTRLSGRVRRDYRSKLDRIILPTLRPLTVDLVRGSHIAKVIKVLQLPLPNGRRRTNATIDRYFFVLQSMFTYAVREGHIDRSPVGDVDWELNTRADDDVDEDDFDDGHVYLTRDEYRAFRDRFSGDYVDFVDFLAATGVRWSEATAIQKRDFRLDGAEPYMYIRRAWKQAEDKSWFPGVTKGRKKRPVDLSRSMADRIAKRIDGLGPEGLAFTTPQGRRIWINTFRRDHWDKVVAELRRCPDHPPPAPVRGPRQRGPVRRLRPDEISTCGCPGLMVRLPTPHDLRHSWTAWQIAAGRPLVAISKALGHASTEVTEKVYAGVLPEVRRSLADVAEAVVGDPAV